MKRESKSIIIASLQRAGRNANGIQNMLVNVVGTAKPENWFSGIEFRNSCLGQGLHPSLPLPWFTGLRLKYEQITVEPADVEGGKILVIPGRGTDRTTGQPRVIKFTREGVHNINLEFDMNSISIDKFMAMSELSMKFERPRTTLGAGGTSIGTPNQEVITDDAATPPVTAPVVTPVPEKKEVIVEKTEEVKAEPVHEDLGG